MQTGIQPFAAESVISARTTSPRTSHRSRRFFILTDQNHRSPAPSRLLSTSDPACFVCSVVNALATPPLRYQSLAGKSVINTRATKMTAHEAVFFVAKGIGRDYSARTVSSVLKPFSSTLCSASGTLSYPSNTRSQDLPLLYTWTGAPAFRYRFEMQRS